MTRASTIRMLALAGLLTIVTGLTRSQAVSITGGNQTMTVTTAVAGSEPTVVTNTAVRIRLTQQAVISKMTVQTSCPAQHFNLAVVITSSPDGTIGPSVDLVDGMLATDLLTDFPAGNKNRNIRIQYTASATFAQGNSTELGPDVHSVTYTLIAQ